MNTMKKYIVAEWHCTRAAQDLHKILLNSKKLAAVATVNAQQPKMFCFRVQFLQPIVCNNSTVTHLSISYPPDRNTWSLDLMTVGTGAAYVFSAFTIETALIDDKGSLVYVTDLNYDDTCSFSTADEVVDELIELADNDERLKRALKHETYHQTCIRRRKEAKKERRQDPTYVLERKEG
jgi:hypothetical protein